MTDERPKLEIDWDAELSKPDEPQEPRRYTCDVCGKNDVWGAGWSRYGNIRDEDDGHQMPIACSKKCAPAAKLMYRPRRYKRALGGAHTNVEYLDKDRLTKFY